MQKQFQGNLKLIANSAIIVLIGIFISKVLLYAYRIIIARYYNPEVYGLFSIALMISGWFVVFSCLGLGEGVLRYMAYYRGKDNKKVVKEVFITSLKIVIPLSIISGLIMFLLSGFFATNIFHDSSLKLYIQLFSITVPLFAISQVFFGALKAYEKVSWYSAIVNIIQPASRIVILIFFIFIGLKSVAISLSIIGGFFATLLFSYLISKYYIFKFFINEKSTINKKTKELLYYSTPLMFSSVAVSIFGWADTFLLGYLKNVYEVGIYNVALPIAMLLSLAPVLFTQLFFPVINREYSKNNIKLIRELTKQIGKWIFIINLPFLIIAIFFPGVIINILFGSQYLSGQIALILLAIGFFFSSQSELSLSLLGMIKKSNLRLMDILITLGIDVFLCFLLIPKYGLTGAALATMISYILYTIIVIAQAYYYLKIVPIRRKMLSILISGIISGAFVLIARNFIQVNILSLILVGMAFILLYIFLILITKSLDQHDLLVFNNIKNKIFQWKRNK